MLFYSQKANAKSQALNFAIKFIRKETDFWHEFSREQREQRKALEKIWPTEYLDEPLEEIATEESEGAAHSPSSYRYGSLDIPCC